MMIRKGQNDVLWALSRFLFLFLFHLWPLNLLRFRAFFHLQLTSPTTRCLYLIQQQPKSSLVFDAAAFIPTITCIWYSNLPSSHLASLRNVLCLQLCQFMFCYDEFRALGGSFFLFSFFFLFFDINQCFIVYIACV